MSFELTEDQKKKFEKWNKEEIEFMTDYGKKPLEIGAVGGHITFKFTPTGLGTIIKAENTITKRTIDLTDYDKW